MRLVEPFIVDKRCFVPCPPEQCNCRVGNPEQWKLQQARLGIEEPDEFPLVPLVAACLPMADTDTSVPMATPAECGKDSA